MKNFIDEKGTFEISVPATWKYTLKEGKIHTFQEYQIWKSDAFQISIRDLDTEEKKENFLSNCQTLQKKIVGEKEYFSLPNSDSGDFKVNSWMAMYDSKIVIFTFTNPANPDSDLDSRTMDEKIALAESCIKSFKLIDATYSNSKINSYRFEMFLQGVGATSLILSNAISNKAFIEATCILASQIDALLRTGIILKKQIDNNNSDIEVEWIYQGLSDRKKSEKDIYNKALNLEIIDQTTLDELYILYDDRNRVIHRFIISEITLAEVEEIAYKYYEKTKSINKLIYNIESEQIKNKVGMTRTGEKDENNDGDSSFNFIKGKIGINEYFEKSRIVQ